VVTAASSPIGRATAARLARRGHLVLIGTRRTDVCERLAARLRARGPAVFAAYLDLADTRSIDRFVRSAGYLVGAVDVLVTDVGLSSTEVHTFGAQHLAAQLIPPMIKRGRGDVVLIGPELVGTVPPFRAASRVLDAWVSGLDAEFVGTGVRASVVRSGEICSHVAPTDVGCLIAAIIDSHQRMHLRVVPPVPAPRPTNEIEEHHAGRSPPDQVQRAWHLRIDRR